MRRLLPLLLLAACESFTAPSGAKPFDPPAHYAEMWQRMADCSGTSGDLRRISWFTVPEPFDTPVGHGKLGLWVRPHIVYLVESTATDPTSWIVPHEMLHDLLQTGDHPPIFAACGVG